MRLRVEYAYDAESHNWSFPSLGIVGGADTRDEAERKVVEAVGFTLEGDDDTSLTDAEIRYLNVEIAAS